ncbi:MAG: DNA replication/repair protein RecF [Phascolarctobacterium sp.]|nr:DNA replication/repair protein RecF [Phascolarctobacterium sp.]MBQ3113153.1 DNA replication/repair protein RecF [Phascolarctobacterium sp.]MBQ8690809.1 DNA replication/repair protein RecF [Phascolarctobacterium sp.]MDO5473685.1 DNA replication/repair protein RecF [Phascolarctobacterium sp.]
MKINKIYAVNFRNYGACNLDFSSMINVFYGQNAQGKTNILEAIFYSAFGMSHRTFTEEDLLKLGCKEMAVGVEYDSFSGLHEIKIKKFQQLGRNKKEIFLDGAKVKPKEHYGSLNAVMFSPEDLQLVKGEPSLRRRFFDMQIAQTDPIYYDLLVKYNRVVQQRNKLLKEIRDNEGSSAQLQPWNKEFIALATAIAKKRQLALEKLKVIAGEIYASITGNKEILTIKYELKANNGELLYPENDFEDWEIFYTQKLAERERIDILRGNTGIGPHRDDIVLLLNDMSLKSFGSQGQQRSGALALKLSQLEYVRREIGEFPILLLDDVMSELDNSRRAQLLMFIDGKVQTFITVNDRELIPELAGNNYFEIVQGSVRKA